MMADGMLEVGGGVGRDEVGAVTGTTVGIVVACTDDVGCGGAVAAIGDVVGGIVGGGPAGVLEGVSDGPGVTVASSVTASVGVVSAGVVVVSAIGTVAVSGKTVPAAAAAVLVRLKIAD